MSIFRKAWDQPRRLFKAKVPELEQYIGKTVRVPGEPYPIEIENICGNRFKQAFYEINGKYLIGMLRFHAQMTGDTSITEQQFIDFENMDLYAEKLKEEKKQ